MKFDNMKIQKIIILILSILLIFVLGMYVIYKTGFVLIILIIWVVSNLIWIAFFKHIKRNIFFYILNFMLLYILLNAQAFFYGEYLEYKLYQFDLDKNFIFTEEEHTPEQQKYMDMVIGDAGRNFMFITGGIISIISTFFLFLVVVVFKGIAYLMKK